MVIYTSVTELIGRTPLMELCNIERELGLEARILAKLEMFNPAGSVKDRVAKAMIESAEADGTIGKGSVIIEPTSGNTGIGLASIASAKGYRVILTMPDTMSVERRKILRAYGAELVLTEGSMGMSGAIEEARRLASEIPGSIIAGQFVNNVNPKAHFDTTGPEIWEDSEGDIDAFVAGVGTGGTITGIGGYLKSRNPDVRVVAVEPSDSPVLSGGSPGPHGLQGIGAGFVPEILDVGIYDEVARVTASDAFEYGRMMARTEGILVGISAGAALSVAVGLARRKEFKGKTIVVLMPDTGERYLSSPMFSE